MYTAQKFGVRNTKDIHKARHTTGIGYRVHDNGTVCTPVLLTLHNHASQRFRMELTIEDARNLATDLINRADEASKAYDEIWSRHMERFQQHSQSYPTSPDSN